MVNTDPVTLEDVLQTLIIDPELTNKDTKGHRYQTSLLPIYFSDGKPACRVGMIETGIGFSISSLFKKDAWYDLDMDDEFTLSKVDAPSDDRVYIPIAKSGYREDLGKYDDGKFVPSDGSPFNIGAPKDLPQQLPIIYAAHTGDELIIKGIYFKKGELTLWNPNSFNQARVADHLWPGNTSPITLNTIPQHHKKKVRVRGTGPQDVIEALDHRIVGQKTAKEMAAVCYTNYLIRRELKDADIKINHMLFIGPTGVGKSETIRTLANLSTLPYVKVELGNKVSEGYRGTRISPFFKRFHDESGEDAPHGIFFMDEFDKLADSANGSYGERLMNELVGYIGNGTVNDWNDEHKSERFMVNTSNILFVAGGAFSGFNGGKSLEQIVRERLQREGSKTCGDLMHHVTQQDLANYGIKEELAARFTTVVPFQALDEEDCRMILTEMQQSPLKGFQHILEARGYHLDNIDQIAAILARTTDKKLGARALDAGCARLFYKILLNPSKYANKGRITISELTARQLLSQSQPREDSSEVAQLNNYREQ